MFNFVELCWILLNYVEYLGLKYRIDLGTWLGRLELLEQGEMMVHVVDIRPGPSGPFFGQDSQVWVQETNATCSQDWTTKSLECRG